MTGAPGVLMSSQIRTILVDQFRANLDMLVQQKMSRLRNRVTVEMVTGKRAAFDQIGVVTAIERITRHADTPIADTPHGRRWAIMRDFEVGDLIDDQDKVKMLADPASDYTMNFSQALNRTFDDLVIEASTGTAVTGETGTGSEAFDTTNQQFGTGTAFSLAKVVEGVERLRAAEVDPIEDPITLVLPMRFMRVILTEAVTGGPHATSSDYAEVRALVAGQVNRFVGVDWVLSERIPLVGSERNAIMFSRSGIKLGIAKDLRTRIEERADKSFSTQVYACLTAGAVRMENRRVVRILANS